MKLFTKTTMIPVAGYLVAVALVSACYFGPMYLLSSLFAFLKLQDFYHGVIAGYLTVIFGHQLTIKAAALLERLVGK